MNKGRTIIRMNKRRMDKGRTRLRIRTKDKDKDVNKGIVHGTKGN